MNEREDLHQWFLLLMARFQDESGPAIPPTPDWQTAKIDAACDFWELQLLGIKG